MTTKKSETSGFTDAERAAMKERAAELRDSGRGGKKKADNLQALLDKVAEMPDGDRQIAERIHAIVTEVAPDLEPKTWYGQPAWAKDGEVLVFFQSAAKFETRYATLGFNDVAQLDDGTMWPTAYAITGLADADVTRIRALVKKAVS